MKLVTVAEMRSLEQAAIDAGASEASLMEEAGLAVAQEAWMLLGTLEERRILVLAGPGKNGGDGLIAGRHLADWGAEVTAYLPRPRYNDDEHVQGLRDRGASIIGEGAGSPGEQLTAALASAELVIDALLGIGRARPLDPAEPIGAALALLVEARGGFSPPKLLAVDLPTGVDADTGAADPLTVAPDLTVTFGLPKVGMYQSPASGLLGRVQVIDIGIPRAAQEAVGLELLTSGWARRAMPVRPEDANKGTFGRVLVVGGCSRYPGAPRMTASAAYRAGAGLVTIACPEALVGPGSAGLPEATWLPLPQAEDGGLAGESARSLRPEWRNFRTAVIGPGLGPGEEARALIWAILPDIALDLPGGAVFDADALNSLAQMPDAAERLPEHAVLTPHAGEMARLLGRAVEEVQASRLATAREAAGRYGCTVVLKGAHTVVASPDGRARLSPFANPLLATAGTGDVLAGMIGAYIAQGLQPFEAACLGVYLHGATGEALRAELGNSGLLASDLAQRLPGVAREIAAP